MTGQTFEALAASVAEVRAVRSLGRVAGLSGAGLRVEGLGTAAALADQVTIVAATGRR